VLPVGRDVRRRAFGEFPTVRANMRTLFSGLCEEA
jgi:hypothetical protein